MSVANRTKDSPLSARRRRTVTVKSTTTIRVDSELLLQAKELGLNVSAASAEGIAAAIKRASARKP
jgi:post-segregation antitoxin (ccd killing protein)